MNKYRQHQNLIAKTLPILQQAFPDLRMFPRHVGLFFSRSGEPIQINRKGMSDYWGILKTRRCAIHLEFEFKTGQSVLSKEQKIWKKFLDSMNVPNFEIRENNLNEIIGEIKNLVGSNRLG